MTGLMPINFYYVCKKQQQQKITIAVYQTKIKRGDASFTCHCTQFIITVIVAFSWKEVVVFIGRQS